MIRKQEARNRPCRSALVSLLAIALVTWLAGGARAGLLEILIDFQDADTTPTAGGTWNVLDDESAGKKYDLLDKHNIDSGVDLKVIDAFGDSSSATGGSWTDGWLDANAVTDYWWTQSTRSIELSGLGTTSLYKIELVASKDESGNRKGDYKVAGSSADNGSTGFDAYADGNIGHKIMVWDKLTPDASGKILLEVSAISYNHVAYLNAAHILQLREVVTDLTAHYEFDGSDQTVTDSHGTLHGTLGESSAVDAADPTRISGYVGAGALSFQPTLGDINNNDPDLVALTASSNYINNADPVITISAWINPDVTPLGGATFGSSETASRVALLKRDVGSTLYSPAIGNTGDDGLTGTFNLAYNDGSFNTHETATTFGAGWHHVAAVGSAGTTTEMVTTFYLDGVKVGSVEHDLGNASDDLAALGAFYDQSSSSNSNGLDGDMDDVGFWKRDLLGREIAAIAAFGDAGFVGAGHNVGLADGQIDDVLAMSSVGQSAECAGWTWFYTTTFPNADNGSPLQAGKHYKSVDGLAYVILEEASGSFSGAWATVPEPSTMILALLALIACRRRSE